MRRQSVRPTRLQIAIVLLMGFGITAVIIGNGTTEAARQGDTQISTDATDLPPDLPFQPPSATSQFAHPVAQGLPAIQPQTALAGAPGAHFAEADVRQYLATHRPEFVVPASPDPVVVSVQFLNAKEVGAQLDSDMGVPDATLLCLVRLSGTFQVRNAPRGVPITDTYGNGVLVFEAQTGNLLVSNVGAV
jgi:hypothetical protein